MDHPVQTASLTEEIGEGAHPLDPLTAREIARATAIIRAHFPWGDDLRVETIDIDEPAKEFVRNHVQGTPFPRIARFNIYRRGEIRRLAGPGRPRTRRGDRKGLQGRCTGHGGG